VGSSGPRRDKTFVDVGPVDRSGDSAAQRWRLSFSARSIEEYAVQLDALGIELAAVGGSIEGVDYLSNVSTQRRVRRGASGSEKRLYFMWNRYSPLMQYDWQLLSGAGVELSGRQVIKFVPAELEMRLAQLELEYARSNGRNSIAEIVVTVFQCESAADGYQFRVINQRYQTPRP
ncbi:MAG: hypothetical protein MI861_09535, partial [Pirellulales bacterium]|nr:hypothetical protein [Pirellulales bacterium]